MWGTFVDVKANIVERLRRELMGREGREPEERQSLSLQCLPLPRLSLHKMALRQARAMRYTGEVMFSSVTDPYQPLEAKWKLTRGCLEVLLEAESIELTAGLAWAEAKPQPGVAGVVAQPDGAGTTAWPELDRVMIQPDVTRPMDQAKETAKESRSEATGPKAGGQPRTISILTKSDLVTRDIDILRDFRDCTVGLTITTARDDVARIFEPGAPPPSRRFAALEKLNKAGIRTWVFVAPVLPFFSDRPEEMELLFKAVAAAGTREISIDSMNFYPSVKYRLNRLFSRISQNGNHTGGEHACAIAYLNKAMRDQEAWRIDIRASAHEAAARCGIHVKFAF